MQNFLPKPRHADARRTRPCPPEDYLRAIALARLVLPADVHVQAPPNLSDDFGSVAARRGDRRLGRRLAGDRRTTSTPSGPWPALDALREATEAPRPRRSPRG